jgi:hypothetical protein
VRYC